MFRGQDDLIIVLILAFVSVDLALLLGVKSDCSCILRICNSHSKPNRITSNDLKDINVTAKSSDPVLKVQPLGRKARKGQHHKHVGRDA